MCGSKTQMNIIYLMGIPSMILYIIGIPFSIFTLLYNKKKILYTKKIQSSYGFLYSNYREKCFYWECIVLLRLVGMCFINVVYSESIFFQAILGLG